MLAEGVRVAAHEIDQPRDRPARTDTRRLRAAAGMRDCHLMRADLRVYAIIDPERAGGRPLAQLANELAAGATLVQLRDKLGSTRRMIEEARAINAAVAGRAPLLVNDRIDVALAAGADGVHVGQDDMAV